MADRPLACRNPTPTVFLPGRRAEGQLIVAFAGMPHDEHLGARFEWRTFLSVAFPNADRLFVRDTQLAWCVCLDMWSWRAAGATMHEPVRGR